MGPGKDPSEWPTLSLLAHHPDLSKIVGQLVALRLVEKLATSGDMALGKAL